MTLSKVKKKKEIFLTSFQEYQDKYFPNEKKNILNNNMSPEEFGDNLAEESITRLRSLLSNK